MVMDLVEKLVARMASHKPRSLVADLPEAAVLVAITKDAKDPSIILTRRARKLSTHSGQVAFPGGKFDVGDQSLIATALRETHEEIGLLPEKVELIGSLSQLISLHGIRVSPYVGLVDPDVIDELEANEDELDSIFHVPVSFFKEAVPKRRDRITFRGSLLSVPSYDYEFQDKRYEIWGLSSVILVELMNVAFDADIQIFGD
jgi:8-oxo-dGTP pyrophosphatase MutT (NUDIX family)